MFVGTGRPPRSSSGTASTKTPWAGLPSRRSVRYFEHVEAQTLILGVEQFRPACFLAWPAAFVGRLRARYSQAQPGKWKRLIGHL